MSSPLRTLDAAPHPEASAAPAPPVVSTPARSKLLGRWAAPILALALLAGIAVLLIRFGADLDLGQIARSAAETPLHRVGLSLLFSAVSYVALVGYDAFGLMTVTQKRVRAGTIALASFTSYAIGHTLGSPLVTAGAVRWRIYGRAGLTVAEVGRLTAVAGLTLWMGMTAVLGLAAVLKPLALAPLDRLPAEVNRVLGILVLGVLALFLAWSGKGGRAVGRSWARMPIPSRSHGLVQIGLGVLDVGAAAAALWILLPSSATLGFPAFAAVFSGAVILALVSHAPAGLGAFEAAVVLAFPNVPLTELLSAVLVWRLTYTFIPFGLAVALLTGDELRHPRTGLSRSLRRVRRAVLPLVPAALAALTFLGGLVLLTSGALPNDYSRIRGLRHLIPLPFAEVSHLVASTVGVALLILSRGLLRRLTSAWTLAVVMIGAGMVLSLVKGFDWEEALILGAVLTLLLIYRSAFYRKAGIFTEPLEPGWLVAVAFVIGCTIWLGFAVFQDVDYSHQLWWQFDWHDDASRFLRASLATVVMGAALSLYTLLYRPPAQRRPPPLHVGVLAPALAQAARADAQLALLEDKRFLIHEAGDAFLMYAVRGRSWIVMGDPVGCSERASDLMWRFLEEVDRHAGWPVFYQVSPAHLPLYLDAGLSLIKLGEEARVDLARFTIEGRAGRDWRSAINRAKRDNLAFAIIPAEDVQAHLPDLRCVSDAWLAQRGSREKGFSIGYWSESYLTRFDVAVVRREGRILAFANIWYGQPGGEITVDLMRHVPDADGVMDLLFVNLMQEAKARGYRWFNLGMAPLSGLSDHRLAPSWHKVAAFVARSGERFYGFRGLRAYKEKFGPVWEPRYLACPGGWAVPQILLDVTGLISGSPARAAGKGGKR
jgi:phosphatidylglycerol lysyltransferase